jgi:hypothetical protein
MRPVLRGPRFPRWLRVHRRLLVRGTLRRLRAWHQWLPSWGTSLLVHGIALLLLALIYLGGAERDHGENRLSGEFIPTHVEGQGLVSLIPGEQAGDPLTVGKSSDFPSFSFSASGPKETKLSQPSLPATMKLATTFTPPRIAPLAGMKLSDAVGSRLHFEDMSAPFSGRDEASRAKLVRREGGSVESEKAVQLGLDWIARHQRADGAWTLDYHPQCSDPPCPDEQPMTTDTAATGLGLLPLLGAGHIHTKESRYQDNVKRGLDYLILHQNAEGEIFIGGAGNTRFYSHAIAAMALCEAYGISKDPRLKLPAQRSINFIAKSQNLDDGGWRYFPGQAGDTSVFGWQMFALRSGKLAGLEVPRRTIQRCRIYLDRASTDKGRTSYGYTVGAEAKPVMTAEALLCRQYLGWPNDFAPLRKGAKSVYDHLQVSNERNIYYWYYATQMLHNLQGKEWVAWNRKIRDGLVSIQVLGNGCDRGSWDPRSPQPDRWGLTAGRLYVTSLSILTLEVYYRWLPLYRTTDQESDPKAIKDAQDEAADLSPARPAVARRKGQ